MQLSLYAAPDCLSRASGSLAVLPLTSLVTVWQRMDAACLANLASCTRMTSVRLNYCSMAVGASLHHLATWVSRLTALSHLTLSPSKRGLELNSNDKLTDASMEAIAASQCQLKRLSLPPRAHGGVMTAAGMQQLAAALPQLQVV